MVGRTMPHQPVDTTARSQVDSAAGLPAENLYGHTKKLRFILGCIREQQKHRNGPITLLDFGCGNGVYVSQHLRMDGVRYYGVDFHRPSLAYARRHFSGPHATFLEHVPSEEAFDLIVYADLLEHLDDPVATLRQHAGLLKEDGLIVGSVPNGRGPYEIEMAVAQRLGVLALLKLSIRGYRKLRPMPNGLPYNHESGHVQFFTRRSLTATLAQAGFRVDRFTHGAFISGPITDLFPGAWLRAANTWAADRLPYWAVASWFFTASRSPTVCDTQTPATSTGPHTTQASVDVKTFTPRSPVRWPES